MSKKYRRIKKTLALTLALVMVLGILPLGSVASASVSFPGTIATSPSLVYGATYDILDFIDDLPNYDTRPDVSLNFWVRDPGQSLVNSTVNVEILSPKSDGLFKITGVGAFDIQVGIPEGPVGTDTILESGGLVGLSWQADPLVINISDATGADKVFNNNTTAVGLTNFVHDAGTLLGAGQFVTTSPTATQVQWSAAYDTANALPGTQEVTAMLTLNSDSVFRFDVGGVLEIAKEITLSNEYRITPKPLTRAELTTLNITTTKPMDGDWDATITEATFIGTAPFPTRWTPGPTAMNPNEFEANARFEQRTPGTGLNVTAEITLPTPSNYIWDKTNTATANILSPDEKTITIAHATNGVIQKAPASDLDMEVTLPSIIHATNHQAFRTIDNYKVEGMIGDDVVGSLYFFLPSNTTPITLANLVALGAGNHSFVWRFIPDSDALYTGYKDGTVLVRIVTSEILPSAALKIEGIPADGKIDVTYDGNEYGKYGIGDISISLAGVTTPNLSNNQREALEKYVTDTLADIADTAKPGITNWSNAANPWSISGVTAYGGRINATEGDSGTIKLQVVMENTIGGTPYIVWKDITIDIAKRQLSWLENFVMDKQFDGTSVATPAPGLWFSNLLPNDRNSPSRLAGPAGAHAHFTSINVGTHSVINPYGFLATEGALLTGSQEGNYKLPTVNPKFADGTITPRRVSITPLPNQQKPYGSMDEEFKFVSDIDSAWPVSLQDIFDEPGVADTRAGWLGREPGETVGTYLYTLNAAAAGDNFEIIFGGQGRHSFAIVPAEVVDFAFPWREKMEGDAKLMAYEAYATWRAATTAPGAASVQSLVDLAVSLGRLPTSVSVVTNATTMNHRGQAVANGGRYSLPIGWETSAVYPHRDPTRFGIGYGPVIGKLDTSVTGNAVVPSGFKNAEVTLNVVPVEFTAANYKANHPRNFADAYVLTDPDRNDVTATGLSDLLPTRDSVVFANSAGGDSVTVEYEVTWDNTKLDMRKNNNRAEFTGTIRFIDAPWLTVQTDMIVKRTIIVRDTLPITIDFNAGKKTYDSLPWTPVGTPVVMLNYVPVPDQPAPSAFSWKFAPNSWELAPGASAWHNAERELFPKDAGLYDVMISVQPYGKYARQDQIVKLEIETRWITIVADNVPANKGQFVGGGLPNLTFSIAGLAPNQSYADALDRFPTMSIAGFNGNVLGSYRINFVTDGRARNPSNIDIDGHRNGFVTVVEPDAPTFRVSVSGGTVAGGGTFAEYPAGTTVTITANDPPSGRRFTGWSSTPSVSFASAASRQTTFVMPAGEVVVTATFDRIPTVVTPSIPKEPIFPDLTSGPAFNAVQWAATMKIIEGRDGLFHPKVEMTRSQIVVILHRYAERPNVNSTVSFTDVTPGTTIGRAVAWAVSNDIATGRSSTVFGVNDIISRESLMVMLYRYHTRVLGNSGAASANALARFSDSGDVSSTALNAIRWAVENDLLTGSGGKILPKASMTRDQLVTILYRYDKAFN
jgi:hypothetical protein